MKQMMNKNTRKERHKQEGLNSHMLEDKPNLLLSYIKMLISKSLSRPKTL
jgi:hypothetical protein